MAKKIISSITDRNRKNCDDMGAIVGGFVVVLCLLWTIS